MRQNRRLPKLQLIRLWSNLKRRDPRPLFSRDELELWLIELSHGGKGIGWRCSYGVKCNRYLSLPEVSLDHRTPLKLLRITTLDNLAVCCKACNRVKGDLDGKHFRQLMELLDHWPVEQRRSVLNRLGQPPGQWVYKRQGKKGNFVNEQQAAGLRGPQGRRQGDGHLARRGAVLGVRQAG